MEEIKTYKDFNDEEGFNTKIRNFARKITIAAFSLRYNISNTDNWIKLPYYHHVFDDEKRNFERQLKYFKNFGEFISIDQVCELVNGHEPINGRYFCISFDDGYYNCYSNMMGITADLNIPVIIYLPTDSIGLDLNDPQDIEKIRKNLPENPKLLSFLNWENCREMLSHKISFGSHTCSHANLSKLNIFEIEDELRRSKQIIEEKLSITCEHFACPWGRVNIDFDPEVTTAIAKKTGYKTFATTNRGKTQKEDNLYLLKRDHVHANWENFQLKFFFGK
jgi:peptidoglycan/xylan/chitin deacetylase (PgdA/CDA1 family)